MVVAALSLPLATLYSALIRKLSCSLWNINCLDISQVTLDVMTSQLWFRCSLWFDKFLGYCVFHHTVRVLLALPFLFDASHHTQPQNDSSSLSGIDQCLQFSTAPLSLSLLYVPTLGWSSLWTFQLLYVWGPTSHLGAVASCERQVLTNYTIN